MNTAFIEIFNGKTTALASIPKLEFDIFRKEIQLLLDSNARVVHYFAFENRDENELQIVCVMRKEATLSAGRALAPERYPSLTAESTKFNLFEREIAEQYGILPEGHPWFKALRYHPCYNNRADAFENDYNQPIPGNYPFYEVAGEAIHEVAVGPVHAGVIEPGHFRFNCYGEQVFNLEIVHGYQHRGIEKQLLNSDLKKVPVLIESIAGDTTVGHAIAFTEAVESLTDITPDINAEIIRALALELERIANHVGDLGALSNDVAFLPPASYYGRLRGDFLNILLNICGNRFGKGLVRPGGVNFDISSAQIKDFISRIKQLEKEVVHIADMLFSTPGVLGRFEGTGVVSLSFAEQLGLVGPAGKACGLDYDVRRVFPTSVWEEVKPERIINETGDVMARAMIRYLEIRQSIELSIKFLDQIIETPSAGVPFQSRTLSPTSFVVSLQEAWRGELSHCIITDGEGNIARYKIKDPSFHNWNGLEMAVRNEAISNFPLCNKSFNLSYCGIDL